MCLASLLKFININLIFSVTYPYLLFYYYYFRYMITLPPHSSIDSMRMLCIAAYGMLMLGPSQHLWFNSVSKVLPKQDVLTTLKKLFIGQAVYGPSITSIFFSYNAALQGKRKLCRHC